MTSHLSRHRHDTRVTNYNTKVVLLKKAKAPFTRVRTNFYMDRNFHGSTLRLHGTGGTGRIFERPSVQVWDRKKAGQLFDRHGSLFVRTCVSTRTVQLFGQIAQLWPGIKNRNWSKLCTDPCKHHCNPCATEFARIHVNRRSRNKIRPCQNLPGSV